MHAGLFDVFHHAADEDALAVAQAIDIDLDRIVEEAVEQHRRIVGDLDRFAHVAFEVFLFVHDFHRAAAQHIARTHDERITDLVGERERIGFGARGAVGRLAQLQLDQQLLKAFAVFGDVDRFGRGADDGHAIGFERFGELERGLAAVLHDHTRGLFLVYDLEHVFERQRFEVQAVGSVVIGRDGFRVAIDHDGLVPVVAQRERRMHAAIIELDALADAVGSAAEHHDLLLVRRQRFALFLVGRVQISGVGREFGRASIDALEHRPHAERMARLAHFVFGGVEQIGQAAIGKAFALERAQRVGVEISQRELFDVEFEIDDLFDLHQEPRIDLGEVEYLVDRIALGERVAHIPDAFRTGLAEFFFEHFAIDGLLVHAIDADFEPAQRFLERFLEGAADRHHFADRLHLRGQMRIGLREFFEREARNLGDDVIDGRLEARGRSATGDFVAQFVERVADRELGRDLGDREAGSLRSERRRTRHARIRLDDDHATVFRIDRELYVRAAGVDADLAQDRDRGVAHELVFLVGQRLRRGDRDRIAGMDAHRVEVLDRADDDAVVRAVADHFHLVFLPADQRFFDQQFVGRRGFEAALADGLEFFGVVSDAAAGAAEREARADDDREADRLLHAPGFVHRMRDARTRRAQADLGHRVLELQTVFGLVDRGRRGADQFDLVFVEHAVLVQIERGVERGLAAHGRQDGVGALFGDDLLDHLPGDGLDVGDIGHLGVGHDGRRIAVDQDDLVALGAQRLAGLGARIVEFAGLADDDRASADDEDAFQVGALRHGGWPRSYSCRAPDGAPPVRSGCG